MCLPQGYSSCWSGRPGRRHGRGPRGQETTSWGSPRDGVRRPGLCSASRCSHPPGASVQASQSQVPALLVSLLLAGDLLPLLPTPTFPVTLVPHRTLRSMGKRCLQPSPCALPPGTAFLSHGRPSYPWMPRVTPGIALGAVRLSQDRPPQRGEAFPSIFAESACSVPSDMPGIRRWVTRGLCPGGAPG